MITSKYLKDKSVSKEENNQPCEMLLQGRENELLECRRRGTRRDKLKE